MVEQNRDRYGLNRCLEVLSVAKSSWHYRQNGYGRPRMTVELRERLGYRINHKRVERLLRHNGWGMIHHIPRRSKSGVQQILHHRKGNLDKVSGREFGVLEAFSTDFTELRYAQGRHKAWLMTLSDLESRWAADWSLGPRRNRSVALRRNGFVKASSTVLPQRLRRPSDKTKMENCPLDGEAYDVS